MNRTHFWIGIFMTVAGLLSTNLTGQTNQFKVIDSESNEPVPYATVSTGSFVRYTTTEGVFSTKDLLGDTIRISRLGYHAVSIAESELSPTILLRPKNYQIRVFEVSGNPESFDVGFHDSRTVGFSKMKSMFLAVLI